MTPDYIERVYGVAFNGMRWGLSAEGESLLRDYAFALEESDLDDDLTQAVISYAKVSRDRITLARLVAEHVDRYGNDLTLVVVDGDAACDVPDLTAKLEAAVAASAPRGAA